MKFQFIHVQKYWFPITALCRVLEVSRSGYHAWISRAPCARVIENNILAVTISAVFRRRCRAKGQPKRCLNRTPHPWQASQSNSAE